MTGTDFSGPPRVFPIVFGVFAFLVVSLSPRIVPAGEWRVTPIRLDLGRDAKSGAVTVIHESDERLQLQAKAFEWTQDGEGKDRFEETEDILFFPRIMIFDRKGEKILRAGIKGPAPAKERTYRLFLEEIPEPVKAEGARVAIAIRFGLPVFVKPVKVDLRGEVADLSMKGGAMTAMIRNSGNVHFHIRTVRFRGVDGVGREVFSKEAGGWYLLAGAARVYSAEVTEVDCRKIERIEVEMRTETSSFTGTRVADPSMCGTK